MLVGRAMMVKSTGKSLLYRTVVVLVMVTFSQFYTKKYLGRNQTEIRTCNTHENLEQYMVRECVSLRYSSVVIIMAI